MKRGRLVAGISLLAIVCLALVGWTWFATTMRDVEGARTIPAERGGPRTGSGPSGVASTSRGELRIAPRPASASPNHPIRPLPPVGAPLRDVLASLKTQAAEGDAAAACRIAFELDRCAKMPMLGKALAFWSAGLERFSGKQRADREAAMERAKRMVAQAETACEGVTPDEIAWTFDYALAAALAGNREARWMLSAMPVGLDPMRPERTLEGWARWRQHIATIMTAGVEAGDPRVMSMAARAYVSPTWGFRVFPEDPVRAVALRIAIARASKDRSNASEENALRMARAEGLTDTQLTDARRISTSLSTAQAPEGGVDWSRGMNPDADGSACERER